MKYIQTLRGTIFSVHDEIIVDSINNQIKYGSTIEKFYSSQTTLAYANWLMTQLAGLTETSVGAILTTTFGTINSVIPDPFRMHQDSFILNLSTPIIKANLGKVHIEDTTGGTDDNGFAFNCEFLDEFTIKCKWITDGDGTTSSPMLLYYKDTLNNVVGTVNVTYDASTDLVTL